MEHDSKVNEKAHEGSSGKAKFLTTLIIVTLIIGVINLIGTYALNSKIAGIGTGVAAGQPNPAVANQPPKKVDVSTDDDPVLGDKNAPVTIIEFSDFQCPYCERFYTQTLSQIKTKYIDTGKVKFVFRDYPLPFHSNAEKAAEAAECADEQGKFWEMHNKIFSEQPSLSLENLKKWASDIGLDMKEFNDCLDSGKMAEEVKKDLTDGSKVGVTGTPGFFVNGYPLVGAQPFAAFEQLVESELKKK